MEGPPYGHLTVLIQRLLTRMDLIEHNLARQSSDDVSELRATVGRIQRSRRLESETVDATVAIIEATPSI